jgi:hypothetical protein
MLVNMEGVSVLRGRSLNLWRAHRRARLSLQKRPQVLGLLESMSHPGRDGDEILDGWPYFVALEVAEDLVEGLDNGYLVQRCAEEPVESRSPASPTVTAPMIWSRCSSEKQFAGAISP